MATPVNSAPQFTLDSADEPAVAADGHPSPLDLDVQEFASYDVVIDARSPREYTDDHVPVALNLPVVNSEQYEQVGILYKADRHQAYMRGVADSLRNMARALDEELAALPAHAKILVYCFRGGKRSRLWAENLRTIGFKVDVLSGGWKRYRRWVIQGLTDLPSRLRYRVLAGPTGSGKTRLLKALDAVGAQVLDLESIANHRGSLIGAVPGLAQPSQKYFDSLLLERMRSFDTQRPVWVEAESKKIGAVQLPEALFAALNQATACYQIEAPMAERVRLWSEDFSHFVTTPTDMTDRLQHLIPLIGKEEFGRWQAMAEAGDAKALFERVMVKHYDPTYARSAARNRANIALRPLVLRDLSEATLLAVAARLNEEAEADKISAQGQTTPRAEI